MKRGDKHQYLVMEIDFGCKGEVKILMIPHVEEIIKNFPEVGTATAATPAAEHLFKARKMEEVRLLSED